MIPAARAPLMVGVNQVIMLSLNMVIIASMIGAGGLGYDVLTALRRLDIGGGVEAGLAIVVLAIALDRLSQAYAARAGRARAPAQPAAARRRWRRRSPALGARRSSCRRSRPIRQRWQVSTARLLGRGDRVAERQLLRHLRGDQDGDPAQPARAGPPRAARRALVVGRRSWSRSPCWRLGGARRAAIAGGFALFIAFTGYWEPAMITVYLVRRLGADRRGDRHPGRHRLRARRRGSGAWSRRSSTRCRPCRASST